jgi:protoporphyrinogen/coproporphyrinogen III oxidase
MLLAVGSSARRHATSELRWRHAAPLIRLRCFTSTRKQHKPKLPHAGYFEPRPDPNSAAKEIAVLGGGVTGLTAAYHLAKSIPHANITVYEKSGRFGGWLESERVPVKGGEVLFEWGPRSLRPSVQGAGWATMNLLDQISEFREDVQLLSFGRASKAASGRYIYYPDHLVRMPSGSGNIVAGLVELLRSVMSEPLFKGVLSGMLREVVADGRPESRRDESVGDFLRRRFGPELTDNIASAVMHGIYAGDIYNLSMRTLFPELWYLEMRDPDRESTVQEALHLFFTGKRLQRYDDVKFCHMTPSPFGPPRLLPVFQRSSVVTWTEGMQYIVQCLEAALRQEPRVRLKTNTDVQCIAYDEFKILLTEGSTTHSFDYAVSTLSPATMKAVLQPSKPTSLNLFDPVDKSVSVMVVNLWFSETVLDAQHEGFGYLIPRSVPLEENPERALGVIFGHNLSGDTDVRVMTRKEREMNLGMMEEDIRAQQKWLETQTERVIPSEVYQKMEAALKAHSIHLEAARKESDRLPDEHKIRNGQDTVRGSKLAVMLGGHWWNGWQQSDYPSEEEGIAMAKSLLRRHLNITIEPEVAKARLQKNCIPQYPVGYRDMMGKIHKDVLMEGFKGRMKVAGPWYQGAVGVNDCIRRAQQVAMAIREGWDDHTGLEGYLEDEKWLLEDKDTGKVEFDPMSV